MFDGEWVSLSGRLGSESIPLPTTRLVIAGDRYSVQAEGGRHEGRLDWGRPGEPQAVDLIGTAGEFAGKTLRAIVRVRGDRLQLCYAVDGGVRPTAFEVASGAAVVTVRYRRTAPTG